MTTTIIILITVGTARRTLIVTFRSGVSNVVGIYAINAVLVVADLANKNSIEIEFFCESLLKKFRPEDYAC
jgi:hypothetical protein